MKIIVFDKAVVSTVASGSSLQLLGLSVWTVCVFSRCSGFLPQSKHMQIGFRLIGDSRLSVGVIVIVIGCLFVGPVIHWRTVQGVPASCPMSAGIGSG